MGAESFGAWYSRFVLRLIIMMLKIFIVLAGLNLGLAWLSDSDVDVEKWVFLAGGLIAVSFVVPLIAIGISAIFWYGSGLFYRLFPPKEM